MHAPQQKTAENNPQTKKDKSTFLTFAYKTPSLIIKQYAKFIIIHSCHNL